MTTEAIEGNVEVNADNVTPEVEATSLVSTDTETVEAADPELAEAERLLEAEAAQPQPARALTDLTDDELLADQRIHGLIQRREMSAAQRAEEKLRRQAGSDEAVRSYVMRLRDAALNGDDDSYIQSATQAIQLNRQYQEDQVVDFFSNALKNTYKIPPEHYEKAVNALATGDRASYITSLVDGAVESRTAAMRAEIEAEQKAKVARILAAELKAAKISATPKVDAPPRPPTGTPGVGKMSLAEIEAIDSNAWISMPAEQRRAMLDAARKAEQG